MDLLEQFNKLIDEGIELNNDEQFPAAIAKFQAALYVVKHLEHDQQRTRELYNGEHWLGRCYLERAKRISDEEDAQESFRRARKHFEESLLWAEQRQEKQQRILLLYNAEHWLGRCYLEQGERIWDEENARESLKHAREHFEKSLLWAEQRQGEQQRIRALHNAEHWLGRCYLELGKRISNDQVARRRLKQARKHFKESLLWAEQRQEEQQRTRALHNAKHWLGRCYLELGKRISNDQVAQGRLKQVAQGRLKQARKHFEESLLWANRQQEEQQRIQMLSNARYWLGSCYFEMLRLEKLENNRKLYLQYFRMKRREIFFQLPSWNCHLRHSIATILAVLKISPVEFGKTPLAHYTSPSVCELLLGLGKQNAFQEDKEPSQNKTPSKMRLNSSTYMNDPLEGGILADYLGQQALSLDNKIELASHSAFFTCFSARVNDLNQFRLYGKVNGVEASGCCLVVNSKQSWIREADIINTYQHNIDDGDKMALETLSSTTKNQTKRSLPLYQVAYLFYRDDYLKMDDYDIFQADFKENPANCPFGIRLKPISQDMTWHQFRTEQLKTALEKLKEDMQEIEEVQIKEALEYIRFLFKDYAFRDEEEFRVMKIMNIDDEEVQYCSKTNTLYVEYGEIGNFLDEVILGTNYEKTDDKYKIEVFRHLAKKKWPKLKVSHSTLPIR
ncbi:MAG: tetratricopeptide repeat protein [Neisseria sp.]|uniref:tetratricopeptide repeat protein n=1 Tax=Neisseria sp. TaxID=192066 RepID=UPI0026DAC8D5|nr:tetratricopeptide repeat protein [Neisseria sp.]MDO4640316.1 tetratricopeptide repeat protein [Neisseria sp.]